MQEEFEAGNKGRAISTHVQWLGNRCIIREMRQNAKIAISSVVFVVKGRKVTQHWINKPIKVGGVCYHVQALTNTGLDSRCEVCCGWGLIQNRCSRKSKCGYCSGDHWTSDYKFNVVWYMARQGSICSHILKKYPNCKGNHIVFSSRCAKKSKATMTVK